MKVEVAAATEQVAVRRLRSLSNVSMRSALIAGLTAVGIATAFPDGAIAAHTELPASASAIASTAIEVAQRDVQLMAYIPGWSDAWSLVNQVFYDLEPFVTTVVNTATTVASYIPVVNFVAAQVNFIYNYAIWPVVWYPLTCGTAFLASLDPYYFGHAVEGILTSWSYFIQAELNYFLNGGWIPFSAAASSAAARVGAGDSGRDATDADAPKPVSSSTGRSARPHVAEAPEAPTAISALSAEPAPISEVQVSEATETVTQTDAYTTEAEADEDTTQVTDDGSATPPANETTGGTGASAKGVSSGKKKSASSSSKAGSGHSKSHGSSGRARAGD